MAQAINLYVDTLSGDLVTGTANTTAAPLPRFIQGDTITLNIYLLQRTQTYPFTSPFSIISNANLSLKVALGPKTGTPGSTLYTQQFTWSKDANNQYFYASLPLNTAAISTLIGAAESATAWFEIEYTEAGFPTTVLSKNVTIDAEVIETGTVTVPAGLTAMSAEEANATFLKRQVQGTIELVSPDGTKKCAMYYGDDGAMHFDPIT